MWPVGASFGSWTIDKVSTMHVHYFSLSSLALVVHNAEPFLAPFRIIDSIFSLTPYFLVERMSLTESMNFVRFE